MQFLLKHSAQDVTNGAKEWKNAKTSHVMYTQKQKMFSDFIVFALTWERLKMNEKIICQYIGTCFTFSLTHLQANIIEMEVCSSCQE